MNSTARFSPPADIAGYPVRRVIVECADLQLTLFVVQRLEDYVDTEALLRDADAPEPPYWAHLWTGSRCLARLIATAVDCAGRRVVEIGCGLGLTGIVAAKRGASVTMIDTSLDAVRFAGANAAANGCQVALMQTDVRAPGLRGRFDYCLAADVIYDPALQTAVARFIAEHLTEDGRAWCAESVRTMDRGFQEACEQHGLQVRTRTVREPEEGRDALVRITEVRRTRAH